MSTQAVAGTRRYIFASYAREDLERVRPLVEELRREYQRRELNVDVWMDVDRLLPGQQWELEIARGLEESIGLLVFVSQTSVRSNWVKRELDVAAKAEALGRLIIPVILDDGATISPLLRKRQWLLLPKPTSKIEVHRAALEIANSTQAFLKSEHREKPVAEARAVASDIAKNVRGTRPAEESESAPPDSVFVVHGHDKEALQLVNEYLEKLGVQTIVLTRVRGPSQSLFQRFLSFSKKARFAIVILTADDMGAARRQYDLEDVGARALQFRARQNVILELGFFYGFLGWENVFVVVFPPNKKFPNFERPSDLDGIIFDTMDETDDWRESLAGKLRDAKFSLAESLD